MPSIYTKRNFFPGGFYHIFNRGANKDTIFRDTADYEVFIKILSYYLTYPLGLPPSFVNLLTLNHNSNSKPIIQSKDRILKDPILRHIQENNSPYTLLAYCLMPNHFHLMLRQNSPAPTITNLMKRLSIAYAMYYNEKHAHSGAVFQGKFKNVSLDSESQWIYLSKYIHSNPLTTLHNSPLSSYPHSSYQNYLGKRSEPWLDTSLILSSFPDNSFSEYAKFVENSDSGNIDHLTLE